MGTASTMACMVAALGLMPPAGATAPAVTAARLRVAEQTGHLAVQAAENKSSYSPEALLTQASFHNAVTVLQAIGGSTNAVVHLLAIVGRHFSVGVRKSVTLAMIDEIGRKTPLLVDLKPSGSNYMNDFHNAGGMLSVLHTLRPLLNLSAPTIFGCDLGTYLKQHPSKTFDYSSSIIRPLTNPLYAGSSLVVLTGNIAPHGCVMKASASKNRRLLQHRGSAVVFKNSTDLAQRIDCPDLEVTADSILVLQSIGPVGNPGMPEAGLLPIPQKLGKAGVTDMLRISDGRMSGTAGGTIILHVSPESADLDSVFGIVQDGDIITCDVEERVLRLDVSDAEIGRRITARKERGTIIACRRALDGKKSSSWIPRSL